MCYTKLQFETTHNPPQGQVMNAEELVDKIRKSPALAKNFQNWTLELDICPCCVRKIIEFPDQKAVETMIDTIVQCELHAEEVQIKIQHATRELKKDLKQTHEESRRAIHSLYEIFNSKH